MANAGSTASKNRDAFAGKKVFALIGGIASGKTAVSDILGELGAYIIDADVISRSVTAPGSEGERAMMLAFPDCVENGSLSRRLVREKVFNDGQALETLNGITHPLIIKEIHRQVAEASGVAVVVMPVPVELRRYNAVLNVYAPREVRIARLIKRDNIDRALAEKIMAAQMTDEQAEAVADFTFVNDGDEAKLCQAVVNWWNIYIEN